jgi:hypothetical protein
VQVERGAVHVGEPFWASVTVTTQSGGAMVSLPPGSPFELIARGGTSSSFQFSFGFGQGTQIQQETVRWQLRATQPGRQTLGPLVVDVGGRQYRAGTATIDVLTGGGYAVPPPAAVSPQLPSQSPSPTLFPQPQQAGQGQTLPEQVAPTDLDGAVYDPEVFLRTVVEPREAVVGEEVIMSLYLYRRVRIGNARLSREASHDGFWSETLEPVEQPQQQFVGQTRFVVEEIQRTALFPLREGTLTIGAPQLEAQTAVSFFSSNSGTIVRDGVPVQVTVSRVPEKGRPASFFDENIGRFQIVATVDRPSSKVGEAVRLTFAVTGEGNLRKVKIPPIEEIAGARVFEARVNDAVASQGGKLVGQRSWEVLILPEKEGQLVIPPIELSYYDPAAKAFRTTKSEAVEVAVAGKVATAGGGSAEAPDVEEAPAASGEADLGALHLITRRSALATSSAPCYSQWWFFLVLVVAPAAFLALVVAQRVRRRRLASRDVLRARRAGQTARAALAEAERGGDDGLRLVALAVNTFLLDRFGAVASGMTMDELERFLTEQGASEDLAKRVVGVVERCERARFAGGGEDGGAGELARAAAALVSELDGVSSRPGKAGDGGER